MSEVTVVDILTNDERYEKYPDSQYRAFAQRLPNGHWLIRAGLEDWDEKSLLYYELDGPPELDEFGRITLLAPPLRVMLRRMWKNHRTSIPHFLFLYVAGYIKRACFSSRVWKARVLLWDARLTLFRVRVSNWVRGIRSGLPLEKNAADSHPPDLPKEKQREVTAGCRHHGNAKLLPVNRHVPLCEMGDDELVVEELPEGRVRLWLVPSSTPDDRILAFRRSPVGLTLTPLLIASLEHEIFERTRLRAIEVEVRTLERARAERLAVLSSSVRRADAEPNAIRSRREQSIRDQNDREK